MHNEEGRPSVFSVLLGIAGLAIAGWLGFSYLKNLPFWSGHAAAVASQADYSAVGNATNTMKTVGQASPPQGNTGGPGKSYEPSPAVHSASSLPLPFSAPPFDGAQWIYDWGSTSVINGALQFGAATATGGTAATTGGDVFLAGASAWQNYAVAAQVHWYAGESLGIIARLADGKNFVYCDFGDKSAQIVLRTNGTDKVIASAATPNSGAGSIQSFGVNVYGNDVACIVNGAEVLGAAVSGVPASGAIGLISWDPTPGVSKVAVLGLTVSPLATDSITVPFPEEVSSTAVTVVPAAATSTVPAKLEMPYLQTNFTHDPNWQGTWGVTKVDGANSLEIGSATSTSGGSAILFNTDQWNNYTFTATLDWTKGETFMLMGRYANSENYVACNFIHDPNNPTGVIISVEKFMNGNETTLQSGEDNTFLPADNSNIAASLYIQDETVTCSLNNHVISSASANFSGVPMAPGSVGFSTWDPNLDNTLIVVKKVSVKSNY